MKIKYLGQSCFLLRGEKSVLIDPFNKIGFPLEKQSVDYCLCTHKHYDHFAYNLVDYKVLVSDLDNKTNIDAIELSVIKSFHDEFNGEKRGKNNIYKFKIDGISFCHMGDLGERDISNINSRINGVDVLFIPIGGVYTINAELALRIIKEIKPKIAIPMHFRTPKSKMVELDDVNDFIHKNEFPQVLVPTEFEINIGLLPSKTTIYIPSFDKF